jgi:hypothetical protein
MSAPGWRGTRTFDDDRMGRQIISFVAYVASESTELLDRAELSQQRGLCCKGAKARTFAARDSEAQ